MSKSSIVLDRYQIDDVLEHEQQPGSGVKTVRRPLAGVVDHGSRVLSAALALDSDTELRFQQWREASRCAPPPGAGLFAVPDSSEHAQWSGLLNAVQVAYLCAAPNQAEIEPLESSLEKQPGSLAFAIRSLLAFFGHQPQKTIDCYRRASGSLLQSAASAESRLKTSEQGVLVAGLPAVGYALALIQQTTQQLTGNRSEGFAQADQRLLHKLIAKLGTLADHYQSQHRSDCFMPVLRVLHDFIRVVAGQRELSQTIWLGGVHIDASPWLDFFLNLTRHWLGVSPDEQLVARLASHIDRAAAGGVHWFVDEGLTLLSAQGLHRDSDEFQPQIRSTGWLLTVFQQQSDWQVSLDTLKLTVDRHARLKAVGQNKAGTRRLSWWLDADGSRLRVEPREQRLGRDKVWRDGKRFPLKLLLDECGTLDFLCDDDLKICAHLRNQVQRNHALYFDQYFELGGVDSLDVILNHPRLYRVDDGAEGAVSSRVSVRLAEVTLQVVSDEIQQELNLSLQPYPAGEILSENDFYCYWDGDALEINCFTEGQLDIARAIGYRGLTVPRDAADSVLESLRAMAAVVEVHSDIGRPDDQTMVACTGLCFQLRPLEYGLQFECYVYPLGQGGPSVVPGQGRRSVYAVIAGRPCNTLRNLDAELEHARAVVAKLPLPADGVRWRWLIADAEQALEVLAALQDLGDAVSLYWPAGESILLSSVIDSDNMHVHFNAQRNGIDVAGELKIDSNRQLNQSVSEYVRSDRDHFDSTKVDIKKLLASLDDAQGRFIRLDDGRILQLSRRLQQQLQALKATCVDGTAHELAVPVLIEATRGMVLQDDDSWTEQLARLKESEQLNPATPDALQAQLRDYQLTGFRWMTRLAHWGAGACLADDMGLGKTMQSLALLLLRASGGPALVVAPTSVCGNWLAEAERFAPSLNLHWMGNVNRARILRNAGPGDLIVCSYGVLQNDIALMQEIDWHTIIADEAQSFKNAGTRRSQAMMSLRADFRMIATGTPIENHLGELWNLFRFINPGLLGSSQTFKERFAVPIEQRDDELARDRLKSLIRPFILRRLKREVLTELPARTEITHLIEFNDEENQFYESLRQRALQRIGELSGVDSEQRFRVLAEITTLRQASCHPALVDANPPCGSAKLREFARVVDELRHNGHRCLVFSQFVGHLALIRKYLDTQRISYQYLDGATSVSNRKRAVDDFQAGDGELFLISLKAGGSGLNLTAADYVIHMDPWWNPAVEDQASDRAYRMGQKRPVTIYRMVVKNTIEEKILNLHQQKRELANALLQGTSGGSRLTVEELVELIDDQQTQAESDEQT